MRGLEAVGVRPVSICDIGCGTGRVVARVRRSMPSITRAVGFEPSGDAPIHADCEGVVEIRRVDSAKVSDHFDVALMLDVFEHVPDHLGFLRSVRHLADHFVFHIPLEVNALTVLTGRFGETRQLHGHLHHFSRRTALDVLRDAGYTPLHDHYTKVGWEGEGKRPWSKVAVLRRGVHAISPRLAERLTGGLSLLVVAAAT